MLARLAAADWNPTDITLPAVGGRADGRVGLGRGRQGRWTVAHPSGTIVAESPSGGTVITYMQSMEAGVSPKFVLFGP
jgi:hypothetical protein